MFHIAICDDCHIDRMWLAQLIKNNKAFPKTAHLHEFPCGKMLLQDMECRSFSAVFLDITMEGMDGNHVAKLIREQDCHVVLVFYTRYAEPSTQHFEVQAYRYLKKKWSKRLLEPELTAILRKMIHAQIVPSFWLKVKEKRIRVTADEIVYIEKENRKLRFHLSSYACCRHYISQETEVFLREKLATVYERLRHYGFGYPHDSYVVNFCYMISYTARGFSLAETSHNFCVSRSKAREFNRQKSSFLQTESQF